MLFTGAMTEGDVQVCHWQGPGRGRGRHEVPGAGRAWRCAGTG